MIILGGQFLLRGVVNGQVDTTIALELHAW